MAVDPRFYRCNTSLDPSELATIIGVTPSEFKNIKLTGVSTFRDARPSELSFLEDLAPLKNATAQNVGGVCLTTADIASQFAKRGQFIAVGAPRLAFFKLAEKLITTRSYTDETSTRSSYEYAEIAPDCHISAGVTIGRGTKIGPHTVIGPGVQIGTDCIIGPNATISYSLIGNGVQILAGARLGEAGFGLLTEGDKLVAVPHYGRVIVQDGVYIGANTCVDRGMLGDTIIGEGSKIDNMSHIGHNTVLGRNVVMAAYAGVSGSVTIGDGVQLGGRVGIIDHVDIGALSQIAAGSNVLGSVPAGVVWGGIPARPIKAWHRETAWLKRSAARRREK